MPRRCTVGLQCGESCIDPTLNCNKPPNLQTQLAKLMQLLQKRQEPQQVPQITFIPQDLLGDGSGDIPCTAASPQPAKRRSQTDRLCDLESKLDRMMLMIKEESSAPEAKQVLTELKKTFAEPAPVTHVEDEYVAKIQALVQGLGNAAAAPASSPGESLPTAEEALKLIQGGAAPAPASPTDYAKSIELLGEEIRQLKATVAALQGGGGNAAAAVAKIDEVVANAAGGPPSVAAVVDMPAGLEPPAAGGYKKLGEVPDAWEPFFGKGLQSEGATKTDLADPKYKQFDLLPNFKDASIEDLTKALEKYRKWTVDLVPADKQDAGPVWSFRVATRGLCNCDPAIVKEDAESFNIYQHLLSRLPSWAGGNTAATQEQVVEVMQMAISSPKEWKALLRAAVLELSSHINELYASDEDRVKAKRLMCRLWGVDWTGSSCLEANMVK